MAAAVVLAKQSLLKAAADKSGLSEQELRDGMKNGWVKIVYNSEHDSYSVRIGHGS